jgi:putative PIN family toxin of toxin-antitoxin system
MRVMIDTNIFISAILFPKGQAAAALNKALVSPYQPVTCSYVVDELKRKFCEKFPNKMTELNEFLETSSSVIKVVDTPHSLVKTEALIRDKKDRPILRAALNAGADLFLTGDKDFLESAIIDPRIISVSEFLADY